MKKKLIVGLGNVGDRYLMTRHNVGFLVLDALANKYEADFSSDRLGSFTRIRIKGREVVLLKPSTLMNLSGKAVAFWLQKEKLNTENLLIITDDIHLTFGTFRLRPKGSDGGHNGLKSIQEHINTQRYPRFRFGIGDDFAQGKQIDYVLGQWTDTQISHLISLNEKAVQLVESFVFSGMSNTMESFNKSHILDKE